jgi:hypothetical protein
MIDWALDQFSEGATWALAVLGVIAVVISIRGAESALPPKADIRRARNASYSKQTEHTC